MMKQPAASFLNRCLALLIVVLMAAACDNSFDPLQENDEFAFTMYGALDVHADTQWVRVMPIGKKLIPSEADTVDVEVSLVRRETGEVISMNDSLFVFGNDAHVHNYWTTEPLAGGEEYTVRAEDENGRLSKATVTIPPALPLPLINVSEQTGRVRINGMSEAQLVMADSRYKVQEITPAGPGPEDELVFSHLDEVYLGEDGSYGFAFNPSGLLSQELSGVYVVNSREFHIASGSEDWPDLSDLSQLEIAIPDIVSNVENGTGFVAGIASRQVPIKNCYNDNGEQVPCEEVRAVPER